MFGEALQISVPGRAESGCGRWSKGAGSERRRAQSRGSNRRRGACHVLSRTGFAYPQHF